MKIAVCVWCFPALSETFILDEMTALINEGHEVDIISIIKPKWKGPLQADIEKYKLLRRTHYISEPNTRLRFLSRVLLIVIRTYILRPGIVKRCFDINRNNKKKSLRSLILAEPFIAMTYDVVHCHFGPVGSYFIFIKDLIKAKFITTFHGQDISEVVKARGDRVYADLIQKADLLIAVNEVFRKKLISLGCDEKKVVVLHNGVDLSKFDYRPRAIDVSRDIKLLSIGRLVEKKGMADAIRVTGRLRSLGYKVTLDIVGEGPLLRDLEKAVSTLGLEHCVFFHGPKSREDIMRFLYSDDIFILPCVTAASGDMEGMPTVLKEAMATGCVVFSTYHSGIPELIQDGHSGFLTQEGDVNGLTQKIVDLLDHSDKYSEVAKNARAHVGTCFSQEEHMEKLKEMYKHN